MKTTEKEQRWRADIWLEAMSTQNEQGEFFYSYSESWIGC